MRLPCSLARPIRTLVLAAHPDDETIGCGGLLGWGLDVFIAHLTDGVPRDPRLVPRDFRHDRERYRIARRNEVEGALACVGIARDRIFQLGGVDQETSYAMVSCVRRFVALLEEVRPDLVVAHPYEGGHPDHDTAAFVARAGSTLMRPPCSPVIVEMTSYHAGATGIVTGRFLEHGHGSETLRVVFGARDRARKERMMRCFETQREVLAPFSAREERFRPAPLYDFARPPHPGVLYYEQLGWAMTGARWRALCAEARRALFGE